MTYLCFNTFRCEVYGKCLIIRYLTCALQRTRQGDGGRIDGNHTDDQCQDVTRLRRCHIGFKHSEITADK